MIKLKNIKSNNSIIECDIYPEDSKQLGHMSIDTNTKELIDYKLPDGYEWCKSHVHHARNKLVEFIETDEIPKEKLIMWY